MKKIFYPTKKDYEELEDIILNSEKEDMSDYIILRLPKKQVQDYEESYNDRDQ